MNHTHPPQPSLIALSEAAIRGMDEMIRLRETRAPSINQMREWQSAINLLLSEVQKSRPEAELPEVTDDGCVCGWGDSPHGKKDCDNDLPPPFAMYVGTHEDEHGKVTAMVEVFGDAGGQKQNLYTGAQVRAALQAAYGQQCAATRPGNEFAPEWTDGLPPTWWEEWFIASLDNGDRVVLKPV